MLYDIRSSKCNDMQCYGHQVIGNVQVASKQSKTSNERNELSKRIFSFISFNNAHSIRKNFFYLSLFFFSNINIYTDRAKIANKTVESNGNGSYYIPSNHYQSSFNAFKFSFHILFSTLLFFHFVVVCCQIRKKNQNRISFRCIFPFEFMSLSRIFFCCCCFRCRFHTIFMFTKFFPLFNSNRNRNMYFESIIFFNCCCIFRSPDGIYIFS